MFGLGVSLAIAASAAILVGVFITLIVRRCYRFSKRGTKVSEATIQNRGVMEGIQSQRISKIQSRTKPSYNLFRRGSSAKPFFNWADHPSLITDAVENGWSRFAFTSSQSTRSSLLDIAWEVGDGSAEFMQRLRLNIGLKKLSLNCSSISAKSVIRTGLPLPGPPLGNPSSFPQEAYFEITILCISLSPVEISKTEGEKTKLIRDANLDVFDGELKIGDRSPVMISVGLTCSSLVPLKIPGSYHGSIGFNSDGSIYLDGIKLLSVSENEEWGQEKKVIGCGFDPREKKVFFTVDSKLVHVEHCESEEFGTPLYPTIAANADITVVINLGQSRFLYEPANEKRTSNPCFLGPLVRSPAALGYEDSGELFSMGRLDSGWHHSSNSGNKVNDDDNDDESDADLFEIVLDVNEKSTNV